MRTKRTRIDSTVGRQRSLANALATTELEPPATCPLRDIDRPFWSRIIAGRARDRWTDLDLVHAANLARCFADIERLQTQLGVEGDTLRTDKGTPIANPLHGMLETLTRRSLAYSKLLLVAPSSGDSQAARNDRKAKAAEDVAKAAIRDASELPDDLIPTR